MRRSTIATVWLIAFVAAAAYGWYGFYSTFQKLADSEFQVPGRLDLDLDAGTYRIYVRNHIVSGSQCRPARYMDDIRTMTLRLRSGAGTTVEPVKTGSCDGGTQKGGGLKPASVSEFRVRRSDRYAFSAERGPEITAYGRPAVVYLTDSSNRLGSFVIGLGGLLGGIFGALAIAGRRR